MIKDLPRRMHLQLDGDAEGECYAPFLFVHWWLGISFKQFFDLPGDDFGHYLNWALVRNNDFIYRDQRGLSRHDKFFKAAKWFWIDFTSAAPYITPGAVLIFLL
jgi:hypothetical protein